MVSSKTTLVLTKVSSFAYLGGTFEFIMIVKARVYCYKQCSVHLYLFDLLIYFAYIQQSKYVIPKQDGDQGSSSMVISQWLLVV